jgi:predicted ester cyclase
MSVLYNTGICLEPTFVTAQKINIMGHLNNKDIISEYLSVFRTTSTAELFRRYIAESNVALRSHVEVLRQGIPDYYLEAQELIAEDDKVAVRFTMRGQHSGELLGIPATNNEVILKGIIIYEMENGLIVNQWLEADMPSLMQQIQPAQVVEKFHSN